MGLVSIFTLFGICFFLIKTVLPLAYSEKLENATLISDDTNTIAVHREISLPLMLELTKTDQGCVLETLHIGNWPQREVVSRQKIVFQEALPALADLDSPAPGAHCIEQVQFADRFAILQNDPSPKLFFGKLEFEREFVQSNTDPARFAEFHKKVAGRGYFIENGEIVARASESAPLAKLVPRVGTLTQIELPSSLELSDKRLEIQKISTGGLVSFFKNEERSEYFANFFYTETENPITGERSTVVTQLDLPDDVLHLDLLESGRVVLSKKNGDLVVQPLTLQEGVSSFRVPSDEAVTFSIKDVAQLAQVERIVGGETFFFDNGSGVCGVVDVGRAARSYSGTPFAIEPNWIETCITNTSASEKELVASPAARLVLRLSGDNIEAFETTTGRVAFATTVTELFRRDSIDNVRTLNFTDNGQYVTLNTSAGYLIAKLYAPHLEASMRSFFKRIIYEGYDEPSYAWQSTSGSEHFEPKLSLIPLIWGTLKATFYAMIFAIPLAIFAAIYSSEFLDRNTRNIIKPTVETMASVPSVVLGFLAAIVIAPWVESHVLSVLIAGLTTPFTLYFLGTALSTYSAKHMSTRGLYASRRMLFLLVTGFLLVSAVLLQLGRVLEKTAFGGDVKAFLAGGPGSEGALWAILLLPLVLVALWGIAGHRLGKKYRLFAFCLAPLISFGLGIFIATSSQGELRGEIFGAYAQRNTLVIAIAMGFAIIPIIYSLAEDALSSVPASLRAGSLACGGSVWQTTARVVLPTAASGIFSAIMIGVGRAVGETMIVVMATGNTAVMGFNPFEGLRSLSANIAVELPEAPQGGTHYRTLFLSALILFAFTFLLNSAAEFMRSRYRQRNKGL